MKRLWERPSGLSFVRGHREVGEMRKGPERELQKPSQNVPFKTNLFLYILFIAFKKYLDYALHL